MLYAACDKPKASIEHTRRLMIRTFGIAVVVMYVVPTPLAISILVFSPVMLGYVFLNTRYGYRAICTPTVPVCAARDVQIILKDTFSTDRCLCQTRLGQAMLKDEYRDICKQCVFYKDGNTEVEYDSCPTRSIPAPLWAPLRLVAWLFPEMFNVIFRSTYSPVRFLSNDEILRMGTDISPVDEACVYMHIWDVAIALKAIPLAISVALFVYGQVMQITMQVILWVSTLVCIVKTEGTPVLPRPSPVPSAPPLPLAKPLPNSKNDRLRKRRPTTK